jgi:hypothetical protein
VRPRGAVVARCFPRLWRITRHVFHWTTRARGDQGDDGACRDKKGCPPAVRRAVGRGHYAWSP